MKILITGVTGLVGSALVEKLSQSHQLTLVGRSTQKLKKCFPNQNDFLDWNNLKLQGKTIISNQDLIINLAGENIGDHRWSNKQKEKIISSRVETTQLIASLCASLENHPPRIINASAIGIYGLKNPENPKSEKTPISSNPSRFLEKVGILWEDALSIAEKNNVSVVKTRFGVVISEQGGALKKMIPAFSYGLGTIIGDGEQYFSWVSLQDLVRAIEFIIDHPEIVGPVNIVSPGVIKQKEFAKKLANAFNKPLFLKLPPIVVKAIFGQMGEELLLLGQSVVSERLSSVGFVFLDKEIDQVFKSIKK